jgi:hypothetical protein
MAGDEGVGKSSDAESEPLRSPVAGSSRPVFISYASHDAAIAQKVCRRWRRRDSGAGSRRGTWFRGLCMPKADGDRYRS